MKEENDGGEEEVGGRRGVGRGEKGEDRKSKEGGKNTISITLKINIGIQPYSHYELVIEGLAHYNYSNGQAIGSFKGIYSAKETSWLECRLNLLQLNVT